jgi:hypothetical protein
MNAWLLAATVLLLGLIPCGFVCLNAPIMDRLVALQLATMVNTLMLDVGRTHERIVQETGRERAIFGANTAGRPSLILITLCYCSTKY